jgi:hypothetical protein
VVWHGAKVGARASLTNCVVIANVAAGTDSTGQVIR